MPSEKEFPGVSFGEGVIIEDGVEIGKGCEIGHHVVIREGTKIGEAVRVADAAVIGKAPTAAKASATTKEQGLSGAHIGNNCIIGAHVVIYRGSKLGDGVLAADHAQVRENCTIGERTIVGRNVTVENGCTVGSRVKLETNVYICAYSNISDQCFIAPMVTFTNDRYAGRGEKRHKEFKGPTLEYAARVGANATLLPGITLGEQAMIGAGSVVTRDVPARKIALGNPARVTRDVTDDQLID